MKKFSKILSVALLVALVLSLGVANAFADETTPVKKHLSVSNPVDGHAYSYYQLFVGDLATKDGKQVLSNVKWGADANPSASLTIEGKSYSPVVGEAVPQEVLDYFATLPGKTASDAAQDTADIISGLVVTGEGTPIPAAGVDVATGYYVIKDAYTDEDAAQTTTLSTNIVEIVGDVAVAPKAGTTEHHKTVLDVNDTTDAALDLSNLKNIADGWDKSADYDFGDHVPFKLTTTIASDFAKYTSYYLAINDTLHNGLKLDQDSIKVYVDGVLAEEGEYGNDGKLTEESIAAGKYSLTKGEQSFKVEFPKLNGNAKAAPSKDVVVYYTATLDSATAVIGGTGNINESWATFSNNPNDDQGGTADTPHDTAVVFTFETDVNKVDKDTQPLKGAEFTLTKKLKNGSEETIAVIKYDKDGKVTTKSANGTATSEGDATKFSFKGLDDGVYTLTETVTPYGYNTIDPVVFSIVATHSASGVSELLVKNADGSDFDGKLTFTATPSTGIIATNVVNNSGTVLPSTGGIGTTIFYVVGGVLVLAAIILLVTKKRMSE